MQFFTWSKAGLWLSNAVYPVNHAINRAIKQFVHYMLPRRLCPTILNGKTLREIGDEVIYCFFWWVFVISRLFEWLIDAKFHKLTIEVEN